MLIVAKFGGTSMASARSIKAVARILAKNPGRVVAVVSAPGAYQGLRKVTDLLLEWKVSAVMDRIRWLTHELDLPDECLEHGEHFMEHALASGDIRHITAFGEYMSAQILAHLTGWRFVDATDVVRFVQGSVCIQIPWSKDEKVVVPGFYGLNEETGCYELFPRGGSDITGAYIAQAISADVYENWTDVSGVYTADSRTNAGAIRYEYLRFQELKLIAMQGAQVFHPEAVAPAAMSNIPVVIKNTFSPDDLGTIVF